MHMVNCSRIILKNHNITIPGHASQVYIYVCRIVPTIVVLIT